MDVIIFLGIRLLIVIVVLIIIKKLSWIGFRHNYRKMGKIMREEDEREERMMNRRK